MKAYTNLLLAIARKLPLVQNKPMHDGTLHIYTDGSYSSKLGVRAYGWVVANCPASLTEARVVVLPKATHLPRCSAHMESAAIVDALWEFVPLGRAIVVHSDCQSLVQHIERYKRGEISKDFFLQADNILREADAWRLISLIDSHLFSFEWVQAHKNSYPNLVADQMLRVAGLDGHGEAAGLTFAAAALSTGEAFIYGTVTETLPNGRLTYSTGLALVRRDELEAAAKLKASRQAA